MKRLMLVALLGTLSLGAPAQTTPDNAVTIRAYQIELPAVPYRMMMGDFDTYKGAYDLANGDVLAMRQFGHRIYAELGDGERRELVAAGPNVFVARDRQLKVTLIRDRNGDFGGEVIMPMPSRDVAQAPVFQRIVMVSQR